MAIILVENREAERRNLALSRDFLVHRYAEKPARLLPVVVRIREAAYSGENESFPGDSGFQTKLSWGLKMTMYHLMRKAAFCLALSGLTIPFAAHGQSQVLGELQLVGKTKADKTSGVWVDGQYVGYVDELKDNNNEIAVRQSGYTDFRQKVVVEPRKRIVLQVVMLKDPRTQFPKVTSQIKLQVTPERAAVFVDDAFAGTVGEFSGAGHGMLVSPGKHRIKIALPGFQAFDTEVNLLAQQKITIKTDLLPGSITQAGPSIKQN
jgi:hypothetical protein